MKENKKKEQYKYLSPRRINEIHKMLKPFQEAYQYPSNQPFYDINKPFKKFTLLKYEGFKFELKSSS